MNLVGGDTVDHKAHAQTADALKRRAPAIKKLVHRYNAICKQLQVLQLKSRQHRMKSTPKPLDVSELFALGDDDNIWEDTGLDLDEEESPPAWLADEKTRSGIKAMHIHDRALEDITRLKGQMKSLVVWLKDQLVAIQLAQSQSKGESY
jgi:hypothetical protein